MRKRLICRWARRWITGWLALATVAPAAAQQAKVGSTPAGRVVIVLHEGTRVAADGFVLALRIQLGAGTEVRLLQAPSDQDPALRAQWASARLPGVRAVLWIDARSSPASGDPETVLYAMMERAERPHLHAVRVVGEPGPDLDRSLALKLDELLANAALERPQSPAVARAEPMRSASKATRLGPFAAAGLLGAGGVGPAFARIGPTLSVGVALSMDRMRVAAEAEGWLALERTRASGVGEVTVSELAPSLRVRAERRWVGPWLGPFLQATLGFVHAEGHDASGVRGVTDVVVPRLGAGLGVEIPLTPWLGLCADVGVDLHLRRQRFAVNGTQVAELGRAAPVARVALRVWP